MIDVIDYGFGNLGSVVKALDYIGYSSRITGEPGDLAKASGVILPGVGSFGAAMAALRSAKLDTAVREYIASGAPFLGVCLGMQLLFEKSEESGDHVPGLGALPGIVRRFPRVSGLKIPRSAGTIWRAQRTRFFEKEITYTSCIHFIACRSADLILRRRRATESSIRARCRTTTF